MLGTRDLECLLELIEDAGGKLVLIGDIAPLPAIEAGGALAALAARLEPIVLRENRRQQHGWEREAVEAIRRGDADRAIAFASEQQRRCGVVEHLTHVRTGRVHRASPLQRFSWGGCDSRSDA